MGKENGRYRGGKEAREVKRARIERGKEGKKGRMERDCKKNGQKENGGTGRKEIR